MEQRRLRLLATLVALAVLGGCAGGGFGRYALVRPQPDTVAHGSMIVTPGLAWNKAPRSRSDISREENWTLNGPLLDGITFIGGLENDKRIVRQRRKEDQQVPKFRADMSPQDVASMIESFYRIRGGATRFGITGLQPRTFLGRPGFQFDYTHLGGDEVERQGRAVAAIVNGRLYLALFDAARMHYFGAGLPEFERIVGSARLN